MSTMTNWHDIGGGVRISWLVDGDDRFVGLMEEHDPGVSGCIGQPGDDEFAHMGTAFIDPAVESSRPHWTVEAGTAGAIEGLTLTPSILHRSCGFHGWVRNGQWVVA
jgi:hypothetical protein